jgi:hypothetical protein
VHPILKNGLFIKKNKYFFLSITVLFVNVWIKNSDPNIRFFPDELDGDAKKITVEGLPVFQCCGSGMFIPNLDPHPRI